MKYDLLKDLKSLTKENPAVVVKIASNIGYKTSTAVTNWINRGRIPYHQQDKVEKIIRRLSK